MAALTLKSLWDEYKATHWNRAKGYHSNMAFIYTLIMQDERTTFKMLSDLGAAIRQHTRLEVMFPDKFPKTFTKYFNINGTLK